MTPVQTIALSFSIGFLCAVLVALLGNRESDTEWKNTLATRIRSVGALAFFVMFWACIWWLWQLLFSSTWFFIISAILIGLGVFASWIMRSIVRNAIDPGANSTKRLEKLSPVVNQHSAVKVDKADSQLMALSEADYQDYLYKRTSQLTKFQLVDHRVEEVQRFTYEDHAKPVAVLNDTAYGLKLIFDKSTIYELVEAADGAYRLGKQVGEVKHQGLISIDSAVAVNAERLLLEATIKTDSGFHKTHYLLFSISTQVCSTLSKNPYSSTELPCLVKDFSTFQIVVIYEGTLSWSAGYGSDPERSRLILVSKNYSDGVDLLSLSKQAGDIIAVDYLADTCELILACDRNLHKPHSDEAFLPIRHLSVDISAIVSAKSTEH